MKFFFVKLFVVEDKRERIINNINKNKEIIKLFKILLTTKINVSEI